MEDLLPLVIKKGSALSALPPKAGPTESKPAQMPTPAVEWAEYPIGKMKTGERVKLRDATQMYQPVFGTDQNSRYYMVAANEDLRVAARYQAGNASLSVRIEGPGFKEYVSQFASAGLTQISTEKGYASIHLQTGSDDTMIAKTLGALLLGLGVKLSTPYPDISRLKKN